MGNDRTNYQSSALAACLNEEVKATGPWKGDGGCWAYDEKTEEPKRRQRQVQATAPAAL